MASPYEPPPQQLATMGRLLHKYIRRFIDLLPASLSLSLATVFVQCKNPWGFLEPNNADGEVNPVINWMRTNIKVLPCVPEEVADELI